MEKEKKAKRDIHYVCRACRLNKQGHCNSEKCLPYVSDEQQKRILSVPMDQTYGGLRFTADAMDCSMPIAMDSHSGCSYGCLYCFANNLQRAVDRNPAKLQSFMKKENIYNEWPIRQLERFLDRELNSTVAKAMYPLLDAGMPVQLGALGDPLDELEASSGWLLKAIPLFIKHGVGVRVGTKGARVMMLKKYRDLFHQSPEQFWFAFSIITPSDRLIEQIDIKAPNATKRLKAMAAYAKEGHPVSLRLRPALPGVSDSYKGEPEAWKVLMDKAAEAGARAISFEFIFLEAAPTPRQRAMYKAMFKVMGNSKFGKYWNEHSNHKENCRRASREMKYELTMKIREHAHKLGMVFGCSDPHFKEYNDTGSCCGFTPDTPYFGRYSRRQMTNVIVEARKAHERGERRLIGYEDWKPQWAHEVSLGSMVALGSWHSHRMHANTTFGDHMRNKWNDPRHPRGPYIYFAGMLDPVGVDSKTRDVVYRYVDWSKEFDKEFKGRAKF